MSVDHASAIAAPKSDPIFLHVKAGMTVIVTDTEGAWRMADVIWVDGGARNPKVPTLFQVADVDTGVINWVNADLVTQHLSEGLSGQGLLTLGMSAHRSSGMRSLGFRNPQIRRPPFSSTRPCAFAFGKANR